MAGGAGGHVVVVARVMLCTLLVDYVLLSQNTYNLTVDLPFYSVKGTKTITSQSIDIQNTAISFAETFRPVISIDPSSFITLIFEKSKERVPSQMTSKEVHYTKIENESVTNAAFGTTYQISGKTVTFQTEIL